MNTVVNKAIFGAFYLILFQIISRAISFGLNQALLRYLTPESFGVVMVQLEFWISSILFFSRESFRHCAFRLIEVSDEKESNLSRINSQALLLSLMSFMVGVMLLLMASIFPMFGIAGDLPMDRNTLYMYYISIILELMVEPLYIFLQSSLRINSRVKVDLLATIFKAVTLLWKVKGSNDKGIEQVIKFHAFSHLLYSVTISMGYIMISTNNMHELFFKFKAAFRTVNSQFVELPIAYFSQTFMKYLVGESDKILLNLIASEFDQGIYAVVSNYGSIIVRSVFMPVEELLRVVFGRVLGKRTRKSEQECSDTVEIVIRLYIYMGYIAIAFGVPLSPVLVKLLLGEQWKSRYLDSSLQAYCIFLPFLAINGAMEALSHTVSSKKQLGLTSLSYGWLWAINSILGFVLVKYFKLSAVGLILANITVMAIRILFSLYIIRSQIKIFMNTSRLFPSRLFLFFCITCFFSLQIVKNYIDNISFILSGIFLGILALLLV